MTRARWVIFLLSLSTSLTAAVITASSAGQRVRFTSPGPTAQIRVQILFANGDALFDSDWKDGNVFDWPVESLADGAYRCVVLVRDVEGNLSQKESTITVQAGKLSIEDRAERDPKVTPLAYAG